MSLKKLRHTTQISQSTDKNASTRRLKSLTFKDPIKSSAVQLNPQLNRIEQSLLQHGIQSQFVRTLFQKRCEQNQMRAEEDKYRIFSKHLLNKISRTFQANNLRLKQPSMTYFLKGISSNINIVGLDLSNSKISSIEPIIELITKSESICKLHLCNMTLQPKDFGAIFDAVKSMQRIIHLDLSNRTFEGANKIGQTCSSLTKFLIKNSIIQILELEGLNIRDKGLQALTEGLKTKQSSLSSLNIKNNGFSRNGYSYIKQIIVSTNLWELDVSDNRLGSFGISELQVLRFTQMKKLNLSNTDMESQGLCNLLHIIKDNKSLSSLVLDRNSFSHNWFKRIEESVQTNKSLRHLSMNNCNIKYMDSLFRGLYQNHILLKLDISNNNISDHQDELVQLVRRNNTLEQIRLKQCGIQGSKSSSLFNCLTRNVTLRHLDLSENNLGVEAGKEILKSMTNNNAITFICLEKCQVELSAKMMIQQKASKNKIQYHRQKRHQLKKESIQLKYKDHTKNVNFPALKENCFKNKSIIEEMKSEIQKLNGIFNMKTQQKKAEQNEYQFQLAGLNKYLMKYQVDSRPRMKELQSEREKLDMKVRQLKSMKQRQLQMIVKLQKELQMQRNNIKILQNKLQKQLDNQRYLNKRVSSMPKLPTIMVRQEPLVRVKPAKTSYRQIKTIGKIDVRH